MAGNDDNDYYNGYTPSVAAAAIFSVLFGVLSLLHGYQLVRTRTWYYLAFLIGGILETVGFVLRSISANEEPNYTRVPYIISQVAVLVAPSLFAASMYMGLGRIIRLTGGESYSMIRVNWLTKIFVVGDVVAFLVQALGAGMLAGDSSSTGRTILMIGLVVQILFFALFVIVAVLFHLRIAKTPTQMIRKKWIPWKKHLVNIYVASILVLIRCIFRFIEYAMGKDSYLMTTEWVIYVFDAMLMVLVMVAFAVIHPSEVGALLNGKGRAIVKVIFTREVSVAMVGDYDLAQRSEDGFFEQQQEVTAYHQGV